MTPPYESNFLVPGGTLLVLIAVVVVLLVAGLVLVGVLIGVLMLATSRRRTSESSRGDLPGPGSA
ncbi:MAG: hypothetical protein JWN91_3928 [Nocardioides sp.]|nr:hypothetical protein [Nocardioides sp.]